MSTLRCFRVVGHCEDLMRFSCVTNRVRRILTLATTGGASLSVLAGEGFLTRSKDTTVCSLTTISARHDLSRLNQPVSLAVKPYNFSVIRNLGPCVRQGALSASALIPQSGHARTGVVSCSSTCKKLLQTFFPNNLCRRTIFIASESPIEGVGNSSGDGICSDSIMQDIGASVKRKTPDVTVVKKTDSQLQEEIMNVIRSRKVVLFMKGSPEAPECGFSRQAVEILLHLGCDDFTFVDVLRSPRVRELIKSISSWPTIPQLYINGEFVGGCDVMKELFESGDLQKLVDKCQHTTDNEQQPSDSNLRTAQEKTV